MSDNGTSCHIDLEAQNCGGEMILPERAGAGLAKELGLCFGYFLCVCPQTCDMLDGTVLLALSSDLSPGLHLSWLTRMYIRTYIHRKWEVSPLLKKKLMCILDLRIIHSGLCLFALGLHVLNGKNPKSCRKEALFRLIGVVGFFLEEIASMIRLEI